MLLKATVWQQQYQKATSTAAAEQRHLKYIESTETAAAEQRLKYIESTETAAAEQQLTYRINRNSSSSKAAANV